MSRGRPHASWLRKMESYVEDAAMAGLASAWTMAIDGFRRFTVARLARRRAIPEYAPTPDLT